MATRSAKRTFEDIRKSILINLSTGQKTVNEIAKQTKINWKTVDNHLVYLIGRKFVTEVFSSEFVRIVELSEKGEELVRKIEPAIIIKKLHKKGVLRL